MLKLSLSLWLVAVCALFGLGALLDQVAEETASTTAQQTDLRGMLLDQLVARLSGLPATDLPAQTAVLAAQSGLALKLVPAAQLALPAELRQQLTAPGGLALDETSQLRYYKTLPQSADLLLQLSYPSDAPRWQDLWLTLALYLGLCLLLLLWISPLARRIYVLSKTARAFGSGQLSARVPRSRWSYIGGLEQNFNHMASQIEQLMADNRLLASSLSHDLRTPIACLRFGLEAAQDADSNIQKDQYLQRMEGELDRMEAMVNAFLEFASLDRQQQQWQAEQVDLTEVCRQVIVACEPLLQAKQLVCQLQLPAQSCWSAGHAHWLGRALLNLLQNASRYASNTIELSISDGGSYWQVLLADDGPGISAQDARRIFQPFVRLEAQSSQQPQFGLGLAIVKKVLEWHHGSIRVVRFAPAGACFSLRLPKATAKPADGCAEAR